MRLRRLRAGFEAGQLQLYCPPQVSHGEVYGEEARLRCKHPERCMVAPSVFVPITEQSGLIETLGLVILRQAFEDSHRLTSLRLARSAPGEVCGWQVCFWQVCGCQGLRLPRSAAGKVCGAAVVKGFCSEA
jgi:hypothetical protein